MMRSVIFSFILVLMGLPLMAQTNVSGTISSDSVWTVSGSPYYVIGDVTISEGVTLTINAGAEVYFSDETRIVINGTMTAAEVLFTSIYEETGTPQSGDWRYLGVFNGGVLNLNNCSVRYGGSYSSDPANVYVNDGTANLVGCDLSFAPHGIQIERNGFADLTSTNIFSCEWPISCYSGGAFAYHSGNNLTGNDYDGVYIDFYSGLGNRQVTFERIEIPYVINHYYLQLAELDTLVIESGNILKFRSSVSLVVSGTLMAEAEAGEYIYFTTWEDDNLGGDTNGDASATAPGPGDWTGIQFQNASNDEASILRRCVVSYAGTSSSGAIDMNHASPTVDACELLDNYYGIWMDGVSNPVISNTDIATSSIVPVAMSLNSDPEFSNNNFSDRDNGYDAIGLLGATLETDAFLRIRNFTNVKNVTYLMLGNTVVPQGITLTLQDSVVIKSQTHYNFVIQGKLVADAVADSVITFTSVKDDNHGHPNDTNNDGNATSPAVGDWSGFIFTGTADPSSILNNCIIKYAEENSYYYDGVYLSGGAVTTLNCSPTFSDNIFDQVRFAVFAYQSSNPVITNNIINNSEQTPFAISVAANPVFSGNSFSNPGWEALGIIGGMVGVNGTLPKRNIAGIENITYLLLGDITISSGAYVEVEPGVVIKADNYGIYVNGGFKAVGTTEENIVFTSLADDNYGNPGDTNGDGAGSEAERGDWRTIYFQATSDDLYNELDHVILKFTGYSSSDGLSFVNAGGRVKNTLISDSYHYGIRFQGDADPQLDTVQITNCRLDPLAMSLTSDPVLNGLTFEGMGNGSNGIRILEGTLSADVTLLQRDVGGIENIAYIIDRLTINSGVTLTIEPGVVIKFLTYISANMTVNGILVADGTEEENIIFTSLMDDAAGGDTNDDGNASSPDDGDWHSILVNSSADELLNSFTWCRFLYGGNPYNVYGRKFGVLRLNDTYAYINNCNIEQSQTSGIGVYGSSNPDIQNVQMHVIHSAPVSMSMFSQPVFNNITLSNIDIYAIGIVPETYSQNATVPVRSLGGFTNITYYLYDDGEIASGTTITIPAGVVFKNSYFAVNGALIINGTEMSPVVFTHLSDDDYGNPADTQNDGSASTPTLSGTDQRIVFADISDDAVCEVNHTILRYAIHGITLQSASPVINGCRFPGSGWGIRLNGVSEPEVVNNTFHNLTRAPLYISLVSYPSVTSGNTISGTTYRVIGVQGETLVQNIELPKRDFAGYVNIPYYFHENYTIGTSVTLTIDPGVILKFRGEPNYLRTLTVQRGLIADGGASADSTIVFTDIRDDFYGGDSNADSNLTVPGASNQGWGGIIFQDEAQDASCILRHCIFKHVRYSTSSAYAAVRLNSASPTIEYCTFTNNSYAITANNSSNPTVNYCDIYNNTYMGINNVHQTFVINAENNWWGDNSGPTHASNPGGSGDVVSDGVDFLPFLSDGSSNPDMGDVSLNGEVQAYDASLILQYWVGSITLNDLQQQVADVSAESGISSYDASLVLQYTVGMIPGFPAEIGSKILLQTPAYETLVSVLNKQHLDQVSMEIGAVDAQRDETIVIPMTIIPVAGLNAWQAELSLNSRYLEPQEVIPVSGCGEGMLFENYSEENEHWRIAMAGSELQADEKIILNLSCRVKKEITGEVNVPITVNHFSANEVDFTTFAKAGMISIQGNPEAFNLMRNYPNPFNAGTQITYQVPRDNSRVTITIFNTLGQKVCTLVDRMESAGEKTIRWDGSDLSGQAVPSGIYIYRMEAGKFSKSLRMILLK